MENAVIVSAVRTPVGTMGGAFVDVPAPQLGAIAAQEALRRAGVESVDEVLMGNVLSAGLGQNPARQAALGAGLSESTPSMTVNKVCGSGLKTIALAAQAIRLGDGQLVDEMIRDGLWCAFEHCHMGNTAENIANEYEVSREDQDAFAAASQQKAEAAVAAGRFRDEIVGVPVKKRKETVTVDVDEHPRAGTTAESLAGLRPAFDKEGSVTAGNASGINDGGAAVVVMSESRARAEGRTPLARIRAYASAGVPPRVMGMGPVPAVRAALQRAELSVGDIDLFELNEAFAAQSVAVGRELAVPDEKLNVNGGAIALGHPIGASGTRIMVTLLHAMQQRDASVGVAAMCIGGGQGIAMVVERV
jgi:acetyl-CoA C-acetyltransferase